MRAGGMLVDCFRAPAGRPAPCPSSASSSSLLLLPKSIAGAPTASTPEGAKRAAAPPSRVGGRQAGGTVLGGRQAAAPRRRLPLVRLHAPQHKLGQRTQAAGLTCRLLAHQRRAARSCVRLAGRGGGGGRRRGGSFCLGGSRGGCGSRRRDGGGRRGSPAASPAGGRRISWLCHTPPPPRQPLLPELSAFRVQEASLARAVPRQGSPVWLLLLLLLPVCLVAVQPLAQRRICGRKTNGQGERKVCARPPAASPYPG